MSLPTVSRSVAVRESIPLWAAIPTQGRILASDGLRMRPLLNSAVTLENARVGILVGALTNAGACARDLRVRLQYTDESWQPLGTPIESEARVSQVDPGGVLPYRFRMRSNEDFDVPPAGYVVQVVEGDKDVVGQNAWVSASRARDQTPCGAVPVVIETRVSRSRASLSGYGVAGSIIVKSGGPVRPDGIALTAVLLDASGEVLEVLTGVPKVKGKDLPRGYIEDGQALPFLLSTPIPLAQTVTKVTVFAEVLPEAVLAPSAGR